jgi:CubicO group peptidase (beta-lactamase class C family)
MPDITRSVVMMMALIAAPFQSQTTAATDNESHPLWRIQQNLLPLHYLRNQVRAKSIPQMMLEEKIPGLSMTFVDQGKISWATAYGYSRLDKAKKVTTDTVFTGASLSKPVTAMAALKLVSEGVVALDKDVNSYLRGWKVPDNEFTRQQKVTLRRLIGHTAGISNHLWSSYDSEAQIPTLEQMLAGAAPSVDPAVTLFAEPGQTQKYSNPGYSVIQKLIIDVTHKGFDAAMQELVFEPAGMSNSSFLQPVPERLKSKMATGYTSSLRAYPYQLFPYASAGGIWTTPNDLARFMATLINDYHNGSNKLISRPLANEVFAREPTRLGFAKRPGEQRDELIFEHWGSNAGFTCYMVGSLGQQQGLVIMTNSDNGFALMASITRAVANEYDWPVLTPQVFDPVTLPSETLARYTGEFGNQQDNNSDITFLIKDNRLYVSSDKRQSEQQLIAVTENKFIQPSEYITYEFLKDKNDLIKWVRITRDSGYNYDLMRR